MKLPQQRLLRYELVSLARRIDCVKGRHIVTTHPRGRGTYHTRLRPEHDPLRNLYICNILPEVRQQQPDPDHANIVSGTFSWINLVTQDIRTIRDLDRMEGEIPADHRFLNIVRLTLQPVPAATVPGKRAETVATGDERFRLFHYLETLRPARRPGYRHFIDYECQYTGAPLQADDLLQLFVLVNDHQRALHGCYIYSGVEQANIQWAGAEMSHELEVVDARRTREVVRKSYRRHFEVKFGTQAMHDMVAYWTAIMHAGIDPEDLPADGEGDLETFRLHLPPKP